MDFHSLPRRDLQALCKRNAIRANMSNAAMAQALQGLRSVEGIEEIRTAAPPPEVSAAKSVADEAAVRKEPHGCPLPCGSIPQDATKGAAARKMEEAATMTPADTLQMSQQSTAAGDAPAPVDEVAVSTGKRRTRGSKRSKAKVIPDQDGEAPAAQKIEQVIEPVLFDNKSAHAVENHNGCPLPRVGRARVTRSKVEAHEVEDAAPALGTLQKLETQVTSAHVNVEPFSTGKRRRRKSKKSKAKVISEQDGEAPTAELKEPVTESVLFDDKSAVVVEKHNGCPLPRGRITRSKATSHEGEDAAVQETMMPVEVQEEPVGKRRTRRSRRSMAKLALDGKKEEPAAAEHIKLKVEFSDATIQPAVILEKRHEDLKEEAVIDEEATEPQEREMHYDNPSSAMRRSRRSRRQKVKMASDKKEEVAGAVINNIIAVVSDKRCDDLKAEAIDEEATKPQEGEIHHGNQSSAMRQTRQSRRNKLKMALDKQEEVAGAVMKELIAVSSDGGIGSAVVSDKNCNDFDAEKVSLAELLGTNFQKGIAEEIESISNVHKSPSVVTSKDLPIRCVLSRAESRGPVIEKAQDYSVKGGSDVAESFVDEVTSKMNPRTRNRKDGLVFTGGIDQSNLLVNTLDKFEKPMCNYVVKKEKEGECWWMLM